MANPEFFDEGIETAASSIAGTFTRVTRLEGLPPEILERLPKGYVLKEYIIDPARDHKLFGQTSENLSLAQKGKVLKDRQLAVRDFFAAELPDLVVVSDFLVGQGVNDQAPHLYELQPNVPKGLDVVHHWNLVEKAIEQSSDDRRFILDQLKHFVAVGRQLLDDHDQPVLEGKVLDLEGANNLIITPEGDLRLIDTNYLFSPGDISPDGKKLYDSYADYLNLIERHVREIEEVLNAA